MSYWDLLRCETKRVILGLRDGFQLDRGDEVNDVQAMSEGKDEMDRKICFESCQDSEVDGSEFPGVKGSVDDLSIMLLS